MRIPVFCSGQGFVDAVVKVFVVGEDDMATDIVKLEWEVSVGALTECDGSRTKPSGVTSVEARPPGVSLESMIIHDGPSYNGVKTSSDNAIEASYELM